MRSLYKWDGFNNETIDYKRDLESIYRKLIRKHRRLNPNSKLIESIKLFTSEISYSLLQELVGILFGLLASIISYFKII